MKRLLFLAFLIPVYGMAQPSAGPFPTPGTVGANATITSPLITGNYQSTPTNNLIPVGPVYRNTGASFSGVYSEMYGGSASAMSDLPSRGNDIWDNQRKPYFIVSTRGSDASANGFASCTFANVQGGVNRFVTNGIVLAMTNAGVGVAFVLEDGWCTNYRSSVGLLCWNTNRFPINPANSGIVASNISYYLSTNGFEPWVMMYASSIVPIKSHWPSTYSTLFVDAPGLVTWDGTGANPISGEYSIVMTPDNIHRDVSTLYANGFCGLLIQDVSGNSSSITTSATGGSYEQLARVIGYSALNPYYYNEDFSFQLNLDNYWNYWYAPGVNNGRLITPSHGMVVGIGNAYAGRPWPSKWANDWNLLWTESNDSWSFAGGKGTFVSGSRAVGFFMAQARWESRFLTNAFGFCHFTPSTDASVSWDTYTYTDWNAFFNCYAFFNANIYMVGMATPYNYTISANFQNNATNINMIKVWQDQSGKPPICAQYAPSNSVWARDLSDGSKLVLMENENAAATTNLTIPWSVLNIPSNSLASVSEVCTNAMIGYYTNSFTWTVPAISAVLFRVTPASFADSSTNTFSAVYDVATAKTVLSGPANRKFMSVYAGHGEVGIGTNDPPAIIQNSALTTVAPSSSGFSLSLLDSGITGYNLVRSGVTGNMRLIGGQTVPNTGLSIEDSTSEFARFGGNGICNATNALSSWPTAPLTRGGFALVNSNSFVYLLQSDPNGTTWTSTNKIGK